ncbi:MAG: GNAT family N-acetyltransferase [Armatimonadota bacterium]|nr:GNAT family N-acetyltransferase [Armatimonadota bacterium]
MVSLRLAALDDLPALRALIPVSVRALSRGYYSAAQIESAIRFVFGPDTQLIADGTYFAAAADDAVIIGCGGWSRRRTLSRIRSGRIRAFFVHPDWARQGIASRIMSACFEAAQASGFQRLELMATLPGESLYRAFGFEAAERVDTTLPDGVSIPFVRMVRGIGGALG